MQRRSADFNVLNVLARLKPGADVAQANAEVQVLYPAFLETQAADAPEKDRAAILRQRAAALPARTASIPIEAKLAWRRSS